MRISDWSSDVCSSDLRAGIGLNPSGGYENGDLRPTLSDHARERQAGHSRHLDIGEYRSNVVTAFKNGERVGRFARLEHAIARVHANIGRQGSHKRSVLDYQNGSLMAAPRARVCTSDYHGRWAGWERGGH